MINSLIEKIKGRGTRIVFTEGSDARILEAAVRLHKELQEFHRYIGKQSK